MAATKLLRGRSRLTCSVSGCDFQAKARGWCSKHYQRWMKWGDPEKTVRGSGHKHEKEPIECSIPDCTSDAIARSWCNRHYARWRSTGDPEKTPTGKEKGLRRTCVIDGCDRPWASKGYCLMHYKRSRKWGDPLLKRRRSGRTLNGEGYVVLYSTGHPLARKDGSILEHRLVACEKLGRLLDPDEIVHHINGDRQDNRPENLQVLTRRAHPTGHEHVCPNCGYNLIEIVNERTELRL